MRRLLLVIVGIFLTSAVFAQKEGHWMTLEDPVCNLWEFDGNIEEEDGALMAGSSQQFIFFLQGDTKENMMAPFEMEGMGFACPSYFSASCDDSYLYIRVYKSCSLDLPEEDKYLKVAYKVSNDGEHLTLTIDSKAYKYKVWQSGEND